MMANGSARAVAPVALPAVRPIRTRLAATLGLFGLLALVTCALAPLVGSTAINLRRAFDPSIPFAANVDAQILFIARLPRVVAGALVGAALASSGVVFQALLRNPLATPFTLGVSAGRRSRSPAWREPPWRRRSCTGWPMGRGG
jgi:iron complex transport system permease protein